MPIVVAPSLKVTVPVGVITTPVTIAVKVTLEPTVLGLTEEVTAVELPSSAYAGGGNAIENNSASTAVVSLKMPQMRAGDAEQFILRSFLIYDFRQLNPILRLLDDHCGLNGCIKIDGRSKFY